jgi:hypothetical protein
MASVSRSSVRLPGLGRAGGSAPNRDGHAASLSRTWGRVAASPVRESQGTGLENPLGGRFRLSQPGFFFGLRFLGVHTSTPPSARRLSWRQPPALRPGYADSQAIPSWSA